MKHLFIIYTDGSSTEMAVEDRLYTDTLPTLTQLGFVGSESGDTTYYVNLTNVRTIAVRQAPEN